MKPKIFRLVWIEHAWTTRATLSLIQPDFFLHRFNDVCLYDVRFTYSNEFQANDIANKFERIQMSNCGLHSTEIGNSSFFALIKFMMWFKTSPNYINKNSFVGLIEDSINDMHLRKNAISHDQVKH